MRARMKMLSTVCVAAELALIAGTALLAGCQRDSYGNLDVQTFQLEYIEPSAALRIIEPYVFSDRGGTVSVDNQTGTITVRETPDMLSRIEEVLVRFDQPEPSVKLHFRIIEANGSTTDPGLEDITDALPEDVFRFRGYRLVGETVMTGIEWSDVAQRVVTSGDRVFWIAGNIGEVRVAGDSGTVKLQVGLSSTQGNIFQTAVNARLGQTLVLGSAQPDPGSGALILAVQAELVLP